MMLAMGVVRGAGTAPTMMSTQSALLKPELRRLRTAATSKPVHLNLRESEARLRLAVETAQLGTYERDLDSNEITMNRACREILGVDGPPAPDVAPRSLHPADEQRVLAEAARSFDPSLRAVCAAEFRVVRPDGTVRWVSGRGRVVFDDSAQPAHARKFLGVLRDITDRKLAEEALLRTRAELRQVNAELERHVQDRTARLRQALEEMEQISYSMIHDLRGPLRAIRGFGQLLQRDPDTRLSPGAQDLVLRMCAAATRMDHLVCDVLNYSNTARRELPLGPVDPAALVRSLLETYPDFQSSPVQVSIGARIPPVLANEAALTQCLSHLLRNAVQFAKPGKVLKIRFSAQRLSHERVRLRVRDNGIGIPPQFQGKVFGLFQRLTRTGEGTGMGLALVKKAAERMGGSVGLRSRPGHGSCFWIELPRSSPAPSHRGAG
jgi:PAS domain S-box-containing protein